VPILDLMELEGLDRVPAARLKAALSFHMESGTPVDSSAVIALVGKADLADDDVEQLVWIADMGQVHFLALGFDDAEAMAACDEYRKVSEFLEALVPVAGGGSR